MYNPYKNLRPKFSMINNHLEKKEKIHENICLVSYIDRALFL